MIFKTRILDIKVSSSVGRLSEAPVRMAINIVVKFGLFLLSQYTGLVNGQDYSNFTVAKPVYSHFYIVT